MTNWLSFFLLFFFSFFAATRCLLNATFLYIHCIYISKTRVNKKVNCVRLQALGGLSTPPHLKNMTFWQFLIFFLLIVFVFWNIWIAIRSLGDIGDDE